MSIHQSEFSGPGPHRAYTSIVTLTTKTTEPEEGKRHYITTNLVPGINRPDLPADATKKEAEDGTKLNPIRHWLTIHKDALMWCGILVLSVEMIRNV